jgi:hypothetical protein
VIAVLVINLLAVALAVVLPNDLLMWHSYTLYGVQLITMIPYLLRRAFFTHNLFIPTIFVIAYYLFNLFLGSYLVPRDIGWNKDYPAVALAIQRYQVIVPYLLMSNIILFLLTCRTITALARLRSPLPIRASAQDGGGPIVGILTECCCFAGFFAVTYFDVFSAFSFQLAILIVHLSKLARRQLVRRYPVYVAYLLILVAFSFENKREIVMVLFLMLFLEAHYGWHVLKMTLGNIARFAFAAICFLALVLTASVLRGYGNFEVSSLIEAVKVVPRYVGSNLFLDGVTDNLELNYNYGSAITSMNLTMDGAISYQFGASLWKVFFLPIPRELFPLKPESVMQVYTRVFAPTLWAEQGSLPVVFSSEMFVNFGYLGLLPFALAWLAINRLFVRFHASAPGSCGYYSRHFFFITVLILARGGGLEQYVLYYVLATPVFVIAARGAERRGEGEGRAPWTSAVLSDRLGPS